MKKKQALPEHLKPMCSHDLGPRGKRVLFRCPCGHICYGKPDRKWVFRVADWNDK